MAPQAILVANSVTYLDTQRNVTLGFLRRTVGRIATVLGSLPNGYRFDVSTAIDKTPAEVRRVVDAACVSAEKSDALVLYYYFGHGTLSGDLRLHFVHPGSGKKETQLFALSALESALQAAGANKVLMILDCCYAGARDAQVGADIRGQRCLLASTTPTAKAYVHYSNAEPPIGAFSRTILDGLVTKEACVSAIDNRITAESLFTYAQAETVKFTRGLQTPYMQGHLRDAVAEYVPTPEIIPGITDDASVKSGYYKILIIGRALASRNSFPRIAALYRHILREHRESFLTPYKKDNGDIEYRPAQPAVLLRYLRFLRSLGVVKRDELALTRLGRRSVGRWGNEYNECMLEALDEYLTGHGLTRDELQETLRGILARRGLPTAAEASDYLIVTRRRLPGSELNLILDLLGRVGAIRVATDRVYFPW